MTCRTCMYWNLVRYGVGECEHGSPQGRSDSGLFYWRETAEHDSCEHYYKAQRGDPKFLLHLRKTLRGMRLITVQKNALRKGVQ